MLDLFMVDLFHLFFFRSIYRHISCHGNVALHADETCSEGVESFASFLVVQLFNERNIRTQLRNARVAISFYKSD